MLQDNGVPLGRSHSNPALSTALYEVEFEDDYVVRGGAGDDNPDIGPLKVVGISSCPKDASVDVKSICDYVSHKDGGFGCVRDVIEQVMRIHDKWI